MGRPPQQAYWVACRASWASSRPAAASVGASVLVRTTFPTVKAGATGTGSRYPAPISSPSGPRDRRARPTAATSIPAAVDPLARFTARRAW